MTTIDGASPTAAKKPTVMSSRDVARIAVVIPVRNALPYLTRTVASVVDAARQSQAEVIYVDNGSTDGSLEYLAEFESGAVSVYRLPDQSIAAVRNYGARHSTSEFISFLDADCAIEADYFERAVETLRATGADATGSEVGLPPAPNWIESAWYGLHQIGLDRDVDYLNSGNFFTRRDVFERVGGFREDLTTGEDAELGQRYTADNSRIHSSPRVKAIHYGNPQSIREFYRRMVWHGLGMFGTVNIRSIDKPTAMTLVHLACTSVGAVMMTAAAVPLPSKVGIAILSQAATPLATVLYRRRRGGPSTSLLRGLFLYWLYYWARLQALALVLLGRSRIYRK